MQESIPGVWLPQLLTETQSTEVVCVSDAWCFLLGRSDREARDGKCHQTLSETEC